MRQLEKEVTHLLVLGWTSNAMYTFLFLFVTHLIDLISFLCSRNLRIFATCGCCSPAFVLKSLVQIPISLELWMIWLHQQAGPPSPTPRASSAPPACSA